MRNMPMVIDPLSEIECATIAKSSAISPDGKWLAWSGEDGEIRLLDVSGNEPNSLDSFKVNDAVTHLEISQENMLIIGTHASDLHGHERLGGHRWTQTLGGGCDHLSLSSDGTLIACIDGGRNLHVLTENGIERGKFTSGELILLCVSQDGQAIAVADDEGNVHVLDSNCNLKWKRDVGDDAQTVSALTFLHDGTLVLCREILGLSSEEPQIALEKWSESGERLAIEEVDARVVCLHPDGEGTIAGLFDGQVLKIDSDLSHSTIWRSMYAVADVRRHEKDILVASWFHLHRIDADGEETWRCEHTGLVDTIRATKDGTMIALSGDNQNDYTRENRILLINPDSEPYMLSNDAGIDDDLLAFEEGSEVKTIVAASDEELYADDSDDIAALLTEEERAMFGKENAPEVDDGLMAMLDDEIEQLAMVEDEEEDLMAGLSDDEFVQNVAPSADAGQDQMVPVEKDGTATVMLDGSASIEGTHGIQQWAWRDGDSKVIGDTVKIKVRLAPGNHTFTLTVTDPMRESTTDTVTVQVEGTATDDTYDLLQD